MTDIVMESNPTDEQPATQEGTGKCPQAGCLRGYPHEGVRHRYAPTKDLQPEPEPEPVSVPDVDERPFAGPVESKPRNHAITLIDESKGLSVAWDMCAGAGGCGLHITRCVCPTGPKAPDYVERWRTQQFPLAGSTWGKDTCPRCGEAGYKSPLECSFCQDDPNFVASAWQHTAPEEITEAPVLDENGEQTCRSCGDKYPLAGDGWDGECPTCADKTARREEEGTPTVDVDGESMTASDLQDAVDDAASNIDPEVGF